MNVRVVAFKCPEGVDHEALKAKVRKGHPKLLVQTTRVQVSENVGLMEMLAAQTFAALESGQLLSKKPEMDLLLRLSGTTQISQAIRKTGAVSGGEFLLIVAGRGRVFRRGKDYGEPVGRHELTGEELARVEQAALLSTRRA